MKIAFVVPHIFMQENILAQTIFAPASLAVDIVNGLSQNHDVTLYSPGPIKTKAKNVTANLEALENVLKQTKTTLPDLIKKKPLTFISLARQIETEIIARAYKDANDGKLDIVHVFTCEEEIGLYFADLVKVPVVFSYHDPLNLSSTYKARIPNIKNLNFISITKAQRKPAPDLNWVGNVYHGIDIKKYEYNFDRSKTEYFAFMGRIIRNKGTHLAIEACLKGGEKLKIAGRHYKGHGNDNYWDRKIKPFLKGGQIEYVGLLKGEKEKSQFLKKAKALLCPIEFEEPFGLVMIEAMACGTPVIAFNRGSVPEVVEDGKTGFVVEDVEEMIERMRGNDGNDRVDRIDRKDCRKRVEENFTVERMVREYEEVYRSLIK